MEGRKEKERKGKDRRDGRRKCSVAVPFSRSDPDCAADCGYSKFQLCRCLFPKWVVFSPTLCIFWQTFSHQKIFWHVPNSPKFRRGNCPLAALPRRHCHLIASLYRPKSPTSTFVKLLHDTLSDKSVINRSSRVWTWCAYWLNYRLVWRITVLEIVNSLWSGLRP